MHDYRAIFAVIELFAFIGQIYSVLAFFRWSRYNTERSRSGIPNSNLVQAGCNAVVCALVYAFFNKSSHNEESMKEIKHIMHWYYGIVAWSLVCINLIFYHYTKEYEVDYKNIEDDDAMLKERVNLMIDHLWEKYDDNKDGVL